MNVTRIEEVLTGEVRVGAAGTALLASALGSCIAVVVHDRQRRIGGIAHVMLPGRAAPSKAAVQYRYAENAIIELLDRLGAEGSFLPDLTVCLAGGANVLQRESDLICSRNIESVTRTIAEQGLVVAARSLGGTSRRRVRYDIGEGAVLCAVGDGAEEPLWRLSAEGEA